MEQTKLSPAQIREYNQVFVEALSKLNLLSHQQRMQILEEASFALREINNSDSQNPSLSNNSLEDIKSELEKKPETSNTETEALATETENSVIKDEDEFYNNIIQALGIAQENAVNNQNQLNITATAAVTQGIVQMYTVEGAKFGANLENKTE